MKKHHDEAPDEKLQQLQENSLDPGAILTTNQGTKISDNQNSLKGGERGPTLLEDFIMREKITHFDHERIPERVVHARGSGAHGFFQVYESQAKYTKAKFLQNPTEKTPVFVRFSTVAGFRGSADTVRDVRGFATKFYTSEGIYDLVGNNIPVFFIQDTIKFPDLIHALKPEPKNEIPQASSAHDTFWDFISLMPESMHMIMWVLSDRALPRSYSMMEGFGVHTFRLVNEEGKSHFVKFHWKPLNGVYSLLFEETQIIAGKDPDFNRRDLWERIEASNFPEFELGIQILGEDELNRVEFDVLDPTKLWPEEDVPVKLIGKMILNRNPENFFAETEQVAFHPGHVVPGIDFSDDPLLQGRLFSYLDTQLSRLGGPNFHEIPINKPIAASHNNQRDGIARQTINKGNVSYEPNSLGSGCPMQASWQKGGFVSYPEKLEGVKIRKRAESFGDHYSQAILFFNSLENYEKRHLVNAFHFELGKVTHPHIKEIMVEHLNHIDHKLAVDVAKGIGLKPPGKDEARQYKKKSPSLSQETHKANTIKGRKISLLIEKNSEKSHVEALKKMLSDDGAIPVVISQFPGDMQIANNDPIFVDQGYLTASSVMFDAVIAMGNMENETILDSSSRFLTEAFRHCKTIGALDKGIALLKSIGINPEKDKVGIVVAKDQGHLESFYKNFKAALSSHRHWDREK
jgi:catalase